MYCLRDILQQSENCFVDELTVWTEISATGIVASAIHSLTKQHTNFIFTTHLHGRFNLKRYHHLKI